MILFNNVLEIGTKCDNYYMVYNILKLCNTKKVRFCASLCIRSLFSGYQRHFKGLEMFIND